MSKSVGGGFWFMGIGGENVIKQGRSKKVNQGKKV